MAIYSLFENQKKSGSTFERIGNFAILFRADLAIVPCQPTGVDLRSASDAVRLIRQTQSVRNGQPLVAIFLSRAVKGTRLLGEGDRIPQAN